jgi:hypothetical protein
MTTRKVVTLALLVLFALASPASHKLIVTLEEPVLRVMAEATAACPWPIAGTLAA